MALRTSLVAQPHLYMGDVTGKPLDYGMVYFGQPNKDPEFHPIDIYYDEALTIAAAQPVRTKGGFLNANGDMTEVYAAETTYSVKVLDSYGRQVFYQPVMSSDNAQLAAQKLDTGITATAKFGGVERELSDKLTDNITIDDFGLIANGASDDSLKVQGIEAELSGRRIDMLGKTVVVTTIPTNNTYYNGWFKVGSELYRAEIDEDYQVSNANVVIGANTAKLAIDSNAAITAIGNGSLAESIGNRHCIAIGTRALPNMKYGRYNVAIGLESQYWANGVEGDTRKASRNVSLGDNSMRFNVTGMANIGIGRNAAQGIVNKDYNTVIGSGAMAGSGSLKFTDYAFINNETPISTERNVAIGVDNLYFGGGSNTVSIGSFAMSNAKASSVSCVAVGDNALGSLGSKEGHHGGTFVSKNVDCSYVMSGTSVVVTLANHGIKVNDYVHIIYKTGVLNHGDPHHNKVTSVTTDTFTILEPYAVTASGTLTLVQYEDMTTTAPSASRNIAIGTAAMYGATHGQYNIGIGANTLAKIASGNFNTAIGDSAMSEITDASDSNVALGFQALRLNTDGTSYTFGTNRVGIGARSRCSADNQLQLGFTNHTVYAYGAVQDRSDARDKIIEGGITDDHIAFFHDVEFKRYRLDYRDDYIEVDDDGNTVTHEKDGSRAGKREHVGVIAQQVEKAMQAHNLDFAGLQHHAVNGGNDVYTVGYQEFIPILGEIVQRQQKQIDELKALIEK